jgi:hypothetical protein
MRKLLFLLLVTACAFAGTDMVIDIGSIPADISLHQAIYNLMKSKGVTCDGLVVKDGKVTIINPSGQVQITAQDISDNITNIKNDDAIKLKIAKKIRQMAIDELKKKGEIPQDYTED